MLPKLLCGSFVLANPRHPVCHSCILQEFVNDQQNIPKKYLRQRYFYTITRISQPLYLNPITSHSVCLLHILSDWLDSSFFPHHHCQQFCHLVIFISNTSKRLIRYLFDCFFSNLTSCNKQTPFRSIKMFLCPCHQMLAKSAPHKAHNKTKQNSRQNCVNLVRSVFYVNNKE